VAPAAGKHAGPHGLLRLQEAEDVLQKFVREDIDAVAASGRRHPSLALAWRHFVEQAAGVAAAGRITVRAFQMASNWS